MLYFLWGMFWLLMLAVAVQDYLRSGGKQLWQPILWEGTSLAMATFWVVLQRRADWRYAAYLDRPLVWIWHHVKWLPLIVLTFVRVRLCDPARRLRAGRANVYDTNPGRTCCSTSRSSWSCSSGCGWA